MIDGTVVFSSRRVLGPISLEIKEGEHWAVLGPNGSGKTTLLSVLGAQRHPTSGIVEVLGERLGSVDLRVLRRRIGVVGHSVSDALPYHASALDIVLTGAMSLLAPWWGNFDDDDKRRARALLEQLHCGHVAHQAFGQCSQGERQRVLIARSLFGKHAMLLLDEPAAGVDLPGREALVGVLDALSVVTDPMTTVHVAHTLEELPRSITHALLLREGRIVGSGNAQSVLTDECLSTCFGLDVHVDVLDGRFSARATGSW
jgi:iron complex transport system ATP-binding protein